MDRVYENELDNIAAFLINTQGVPPLAAVEQAKTVIRSRARSKDMELKDKNSSILTPEKDQNANS